MFGAASSPYPGPVGEGLRTDQYDVIVSRLDAITDSVHNVSSTDVQHVTTLCICRVSTTEQTTDNQLREISAAGFSIDRKRTVAERVSGSVAAGQRPGFPS
jgi:hypothetical protein